MKLSPYHRTRRISIAAVLVLAFVAVGFVHSTWAESGVHGYIEAVGVVLIAAGILGRMWCVLYIGSRKSKTLIALGPYSVTRNPLYVFSTIAAAGAGSQSGSIVIAAVFTVACAAIFHLVIAAEETYLSGVLGEDYQSYLATVPRFFPNFRLFRDDPVLSVTTRIVYRTFFDGLVFFVSVPILELVEHLQDAHILPVLLRLP